MQRTRSHSLELAKTRSFSRALIGRAISRVCRVCCANTTARVVRHISHPTVRGCSDWTARCSVVMRTDAANTQPDGQTERHIYCWTSDIGTRRVSLPLDVVSREYDGVSPHKMPENDRRKGAEREHIESGLFPYLETSSMPKESAADLTVPTKRNTRKSVILMVTGRLPRAYYVLDNNIQCSLHAKQRHTPVLLFIA